MKYFKKHFYLLLIISLSITVYLLTFPRENGMVDSGLFAAAATTLGIPLPPGYPSYLVIAHLFTKLPFSINTNLYLLSILSSVLTLTLIFIIIRLILKKDQDKFINLSAFCATISLAFSYQFWSSAISIEAFPLTTTFIFLIIYLLIKLREEIIQNNYKINNKIKKILIFISATLSIGLGLNPIIIFVFAPILVFAIFFKDLILKNLKFIFLTCLLILFLVIIIYSYLPIRALSNPYLNFGNPISLDSIINVISSKDFLSKKNATGDIIGFTLNIYVLKQNLFNFLRMLVSQFNPLIFIFMTIGIINLKKKKSTLLMIVFLLIFGSLLSLLYRSGNQEYWLIPTFGSIIIFSGVGLNYILTRYANNISKNKEVILTVILLAISFAPFLVWIEKLNRSENNITSLYIQNLYANIEKNGVIIGGGNVFESQTAYAKIVKKQRSDIFPLIGNFLYDFNWYRENIAKNRNLIISSTLERLFLTTDKYNQEKILEQIVKDNPNKTFYIDKDYLAAYATSILNSCNEENCKLGSYFLIDNGLSYKISSTLEKSKIPPPSEKLIYKNYLENFAESQIKFINETLTPKLNHDLYINYPSDFMLTKYKNTITLANTKINFNIKLEYLNLAKNTNYKSLIDADKTTLGNLETQGLASFPNTSFSYVKIFNSESGQTYLFYLFYQEKLIKATVYPFKSEYMHFFDEIIASLKFP